MTELDLDKIRKRHRTAELAIDRNSTPSWFIHAVVDAAALIDEVERLRKASATHRPRAEYPELSQQRTWDGLRERFAAASATAGHCQHPGAESCEQWWQADAALRVLDEWMREIRSLVWHAPNGDIRIHPSEIEIVRHPS